MADYQNNVVISGANIDNASKLADQITTLSTPDTTLTVTNTPSAKRVLSGKKLDFVIEITNGGSADALAVEFSDEIDPAVLTYVSATASNSAVFAYDSGTKKLTATIGTIPYAAGSNTVTVTIKTTVV